MSDHDDTPDQTSPVPRVDQTRPITPARPESSQDQGSPWQQPGSAPAQPGQAQPGQGAPQTYGQGGPGAQAQPTYAQAQPAYGQGGQPAYGQPGQGAQAQPTFAQQGQPGAQHRLPQAPTWAAAGAAGAHGATPVAAGPRPARGNRFAVPLAALLAAVLASTGTYALTRDDTQNAAAGGATTVVQANPAEFADAGSINWSATASKVTPSVVAITARSGAGGGGAGSGVVLDKKGNIATNNHVVAGSDQLQVTLANNRTYAAKVVGTDPSTDLAVIKLQNPPSDLKPATLGDDSKLVVGQPVMAIGNPLGLAGTVTTGIVSALNRPVSTQSQQQPSPDQGPALPGQPGRPGGQESTEVVTNAIQTSAAINPGNSGGALVNGSGELIGINSSIATLSGSSGSSQSGNIGIGFAIPVTVVKNITGQLIAKGSAQHARLGVTARTGNVELDGAQVSGAQVASIEQGSSAASAGLREGDVIISIDGDAVDSSTSLVGQVRERKVGQRVALVVVRDGKRVNVTVTLGAAPSTS